MPRKTIPIAEHEAIVAALTAFIVRPKHPHRFPVDANGGYRSIGWVIRVIDGDTVKVRVKMPHNQTPIELDIRLRGLWIEELDSADPAARARAEQAKADLESLAPLGVPVTVWTFKRTYYRYEGEVRLDAGPNAGQHLEQLQLAKGIVRQVPVLPIAD